MSTVTEESAIEFSNWVHANSASYLEAAIFGFPRDLQNRDCTVGYSGRQEVYDSLSELLEALGGRPRLVGTEPGRAQLFAKAVYGAWYVHTFGLFYGAAICEAVGAPTDVYFEQLNEHWQWSVQDSEYAKQIVSRDFSPISATLSQAVLTQSQYPPLCERFGIDTGLADFMHRFVQSAIDKGDGDKDLSVLFEHFLPQAGPE